MDTWGDASRPTKVGRMSDEWSGPWREFPFPVEHGHLLGFRRAIGEELTGELAPPTFAAATDHFDPAFDRRPPHGRGWQAGLPPSHLHVEHHFTYVRPVRVGDALVARKGPGRRWEKEGRSGRLRFVEERTELRDADGALVLVMLWVDVHAERSHVALTNAQQPAAAVAAPEPAEGTVRVRLATDLSRTQFVMYAGASGDFHPLHHDDAMASAHGYPSVFAPGMLTMAHTARAVTAVVDPAALTGFGGRFRAQVWPGDSLHGDVRRVSATRLEVRTAKADGTAVFEGYATTV